MRRGQSRPQDSLGVGRGIEGGRRQNRNTKPCPEGGKGRGKGQGQGKGKNR